jgi:hypothetical protein
MSKELEKFKAEQKKLAAVVKMYSLENVSAAKKSYALAVGDAVASGESHVREAMAIARDNGVQGDKLADFMKDKKFAAAVDVFRTAVKKCKDKKEMLATLCNGAGKTHDLLAVQLAAMDKDLKGRPGKSASKAEIQALRDDVAKTMKEMKTASGLEATLNKRDQTYTDNFDAHMTRLLKTAPDAAEIARDNTMLPQMLVDRNRKKQVSLAMAALKRVNEACSKALDAAADDMAAAQPLLAAAAKDVTAITALRDAFKKAVDHADSTKALHATKDEKAVRKAMADLDKALDAANRKLRGTATTLKKAKA